MEENVKVNSELTDMVKKHLQEMYDLGRKDMKESILIGLEATRLAFRPELWNCLDLIKTLISKAE
jgi:hypothetical protein